MTEQQERRERTYPPPFPDGWYRVANSKDIKPGEVRHIQCLGEQIALFRSDTGRIAALEAFCPHLGANLAYGEVKGDRLQCPFHGWQLDGNGRVCQPRISEAFVQRRWEAIEYYGMILVYHPASGKPPPYQLPSQEKIDSGQQSYRGHHDAGEAEIHIIEFAENTVDFTHFSTVHGTICIPWTQIKLPWIKIRHKPSWSSDKHLAYFKDEAKLEIRDKIYENAKCSALLTFLGPGSVVKFELDIPKIGEITMFQTFTPVEAMKQQITLRWFASRKVPGILASCVVGSWFSQLKEDLGILKRKIYQKNPLQAKSEGHLLDDMRRWYQQFY